MEFEKQYKIYQQEVEQKLPQYIRAANNSESLMKAMEYSLMLGGKRIRPVLALATCELLHQPTSQVLPAACALEMIHTYSLIHDDLPSMDDDDLRRGKPTNHKVYGEAIAILAGDGLLTEAFSCLSDPAWHLSDHQKIRVIHCVAEAAGAKGMVAGQVLDLEHEGKECNEQQLENIHLHKTGKLILASILAGAHAASANPTQIQTLDTFGRKIGLAFQIADDILDLTQTTEQLGKNAKSDLKKNKSTYPSLIGMDASKQKAEKLLTESLDLLSTFGERSTFLKELATLIVRRKS
jgi:geranylgeranyl diphosphate synthase type II